jgi:O-antigen/teichoic acid export membrane protein
LLGVIGARTITFPITAVCGLLWLRLVISNLGTTEYAFVAVVVGLQFVLYLLDFGTASTVLEEAGRYRVHRALDPVASALGRAWRVIVTGNLILVLVALGLAAAGAWGPILGFPAKGTVASLCILVTLALNLVARPLSLATALVAGLGRPAVATWAQALAGVVSLGLVALCFAAGAALPLVVVTPVAGQMLAALVPLAVSARAAPGLLSAGLRQAVRSSGGGRKLRDLAIPMLLIQVIAPLNNQLDRLALSHLSTVEAVAVYALAAQLAMSAESFITVLQPALWGEYAERRARGGMRMAVLLAFSYVRRFWPLAVAFGAAFSGAAFVVGPIVADGELRLPWVLCLTLGAILPVAAVQVIVGIALTDPGGLRAQVVLLVCTTGLNLALTVAWAPSLGAVGPALATLTTTVVHLPLLCLLARRRLREQPVSPSTGQTSAGAEQATGDVPRPAGDDQRPATSVHGTQAEA